MDVTDLGRLKKGAQSGLPIDGRVVLRAPKDDDAQRPEQRADNGNVSRLRRK